MYLAIPRLNKRLDHPKSNINKQILDNRIVFIFYLFSSALSS